MILKTVHILNIEVNMEEPTVYLISSPDVNLKSIKLAMKLCYSDKEIEDILKDLETNLNEESDNKLLEKVIDSGHLSILEHISFTFGIEGVSRALSHQLVRHRLASFSQKSQRYTKEHDFSYIIPKSIKNNGKALNLFKKMMIAIDEAYFELTFNYNIPKEDARFILPNATETKLIMTMNIRELLHFLNLRCCERSQWEIRTIAYKILDICYKKLPIIFKNAGASCVSGICPEKSMSCKKASEVKDYTNKLKGESNE